MIRLFVAEDQALVRSALVKLLSFEPDFEIVGEAADGLEAITKAPLLMPDVALVDIEMPKASGLEVIQQLRIKSPLCKCVVVTTFARPGYIQRAIETGAYGYLLKDADVDELATAIRQIHAGKRVMSVELMMSAWQFQNPLTAREIDVLRAAASGLTTREIAREVSLSEGTVRNYISEILNKLDASSRLDAIKIAHGQGWMQ